MFVAALAQENETETRKPARAATPEVNAPPEGTTSPPGKEVMTAAMARQMFESAMARGI